jgi:hypothetical protein
MNINEWVLIAIIFSILVLAYRAGYYMGDRNIALKTERHESRVSSIQAGLMGLLGVMLAFSFSLSSQRFEKRRQLVIEESLKIGTVYYRAGLLPDTTRTGLRYLLSKYLDERIRFYATGNSYEDMFGSEKRSEHLQVMIWFKTAALARTHPTLNTNVTILALNEMIDIGGNVTSEFQNRVPIFILLLLAFMAICTILTVGYSDGLTSDRNIGFAIVLNLVLCATLLLIIDMDRPTSGFLTTDTYGLTSLRKEIDIYSKFSK